MGILEIVVFSLILIICIGILFYKILEVETSIQETERKIRHLENEINSVIENYQYIKKNNKENNQEDTSLQQENEINIPKSNEETQQENILPEYILDISEEREINTIKQIVLEENKLNKTTKQSNNNFNIQKIFLENIFNKIGAVAIIIAAIIFIKLISPLFVFTPEMKLALGFISGAGMIIGALFMHRKEKYKIYSEVLLGTGFAVSFVTDYCAYSLLNIFNSITTIIVGGILLICAYFIADKMKTLSMLIIGLTGAYLTPIFAGGDMDTILSYLLYINILSIIYTIRNKNTNYINIINLIITSAVFTYYQISDFVNCIYPITLWISYIIYDLFRNKTNKTDNILSYINYIILTFFTIFIFYETVNTIGWILFACAIVYGILSYISRKNKNKLFIGYEYSILINIWLFIFFILNDIFSVISWSILGFVIFCITEKLQQTHLRWGGILYFSTAFVSTFLAKYDNEVCFLSEYNPIWNLRTLICSIPAVSMIGSALTVKNNSKKIYEFLFFSGISLIYLYIVAEINSIISSLIEYSSFVEFNKLMIYIIIGFVYSLRMKRLSIINNSRFFDVIYYIISIISAIVLICFSYTYPNGIIPILNFRFAAYLFAIIACIIFSKWTKNNIYKYIAVLLGFMLCHVESVGITEEFDNLLYIISVSWVLYSGITTITGILKNKKYLINTGIVLSILSIIRIFIFDLANVEAIYKLIAFLALGIILMLISYIYTSNKKKG